MNRVILLEGLPGTGKTTNSYKLYTEDAWFIPALKEISGIRPVAVMEDKSAIFIKPGAVWKIGNIHWIDNGKIRDWFPLDVQDI